MAKPTESYDWATDAVYDEAGEDWDGEPTKVNPTAGRRAEGFVPASKVAADFVNYLLNAIGKWIGWFDDRFDGSGVDLDGALTHTLWIGADESEDGQLNTNTSFTLGWTFNFAGAAYHLVSTAGAPGNEAARTFAVGRRLPRNATITEYGVRWKPGAARAAGDRMELALWYVDMNAGTTAPDQNQVGTTVKDDGTTNWQTSFESGLTQAANKEVFYLSVISGNDAGTNADNLAGVYVKFTCPTLRNE